MDSLRVHGKAVAHDKIDTGDHDPKYLNTRIGMNSRLDAIQAAILLEKLKIFPEEIDLRNAVADRYAKGLASHVKAYPAVIDGGRSVWAQYVIEHDDRDDLIAHLKAVASPPPSTICAHPPAKPMPIMGAAQACRCRKPRPQPCWPCPYPYLDEATQGRIIEAIASYKR